MRRSLRAGVATWTVLALAPTACDRFVGSTPGDEPAAVVVDTLASGRVVVTTNDTEEADGEEWRLERVVHVSPSDEPEAPPFDRIVDVARDRAGRLFVLDAGSASVRGFSPEGAPLGTLVGPRDSTAPLRAPYALLLDPRGRIWVGDGEARTYATFEADGRFVGAMSSPLLSGHLEGQMRIVGNRLFDLGFLMSDARVDHVADPMTALGPGLVVFALDRALAPSDTLVFPYASQGDPVPHAPRSVAAVGPRGEIWMGRGDRPALHQLDLRGDTLRTLTWSDDPIDLDAVDAAALQAWLVGQSDEPAALDAVTLPAVYPYFERIIAAEDGTLWLYRRTSSSSGRFEVFDAEGHHIALVATDLHAGFGGVHPVVDREHLVGVVIDSAGAQSVVVDRIVRPDLLEP